MIAGESSISAPAAGVRRKQQPLKTAGKARFFVPKIETESEVRGAWKYPEVKADKLGSWVALGFAVMAHAAFFFGSGKSKPAAPVVAQKEVTEVALFVAPPIPEEELIERETPGETVEEAGGIDVPALPDLPTTVSLGDFVQDVQVSIPRADISAKSLSQIPAGFRPGGTGGSGSGLGNVFSLSDLDRQPTPTYRPLPAIPRHLLTAATGVSVTVEFVVTTKGEVLNARVVSSGNQRFDDVALGAIKRWKFKPGFRQGRTVNVSMSQAIDFTVSGS